MHISSDKNQFEFSVSEIVSSLSVSQQAALVIFYAIPSIATNQATVPEELKAPLKAIFKYPSWVDETASGGVLLSPFGAKLAQEANMQLSNHYEKTRWSYKASEVALGELELFETLSPAELSLIIRASKYDQMVRDGQGWCSDRHMSATARKRAGRKERKITLQTEIGTPRVAKPGRILNTPFDRSKSNPEWSDTGLSSEPSTRLTAPSQCNNVRLDPNQALTAVRTILKIQDVPSDTAAKVQIYWDKLASSDERDISVRENSVGAIISFYLNGASGREHGQIMLDKRGNIVKVYGLSLDP